MDDMKKKKITELLERKKRRLELYYNREEEMLDGGVQSYGQGTGTWPGIIRIWPIFKRP